MLALVLAALIGAGAESGFAGGSADTPCQEPKRALALRHDPRAHRGLLVGLHVTLRAYQGPELCARASQARRTGTAAVREDFSWEDIQPGPATWDWSVPDRIAGAAARWGLILLPLLDGRPTWVTSRSMLRQSYAQFTAAVVTRYAPGGVFWRAHPQLARHAPRWFELMNEPYERTNPDRLSPEDYAAAARGAIAAARAANPQARLLIEGEAGYQRPDGSWGDWMAELLRADPTLATAADGVAVHPYSVNPPRSYQAGGPPTQVGRLQLVHRTMAAHRAARRPLWITEVGWSTCNYRPSCVSESQQAQDLRRVFSLARTPWRSYVRALFVYDYADQPTRAFGDAQSFFGVIRPDGSAKPAAGVFARVARGR